VALANTVLNHYYGKEKEFQDAFGFPMKDSKGNYNTGMLAVDFYSYALKKMIGNNMPTADTGKEDNYIRSFGQGYSTADTPGYFRAYMREHGKDVDIVTCNNSDITTDNLISIAKKGEIILEAKAYTLYNEDGSNYNYPVSDSHHAMVITGVTSDGYFIVSSWGNKLYLKETELKTLSYYIFIQVVYK
jgi:hypothetical protein